MKLNRRTVCCSGVALIWAIAIIGLAGCTFVDSVGDWITDPSATAPPPGGVSPERAGSAQPGTPAATGDQTSTPRPTSEEPSTTETATPAVKAEAPPPPAESIPVDETEHFEAPDGQRLASVDSKQFENGLIVQDLRLGDGAECHADSAIVVRFHGTLADGTVIDTTRGGEPRGPWPLDQLMTGWRQGLVGMRVGGVRRLVIPPALAYGDKDVTATDTGAVLIPAGSTLIYSVELVDIR